MITRYLLIAAVFGSIGVSTWIVLLQRENSALAAENERLTARVETCSARLVNILEDRADDATVDNPRDFPVPDGWLLPADP